MINILVLSVLAVMCGAESITEIESFGHSKREWLAQYLDIESGIPSHDTITRVLGLIQPDELEEAFTDWVQQTIKGRHKLNAISLDGKSVKGTERGFHRVRPLHVISAYSHSHGLTLTQARSSSSGQAEGPAAVECLRKLNIKDAMVLADAGLASHRVTKQIREQKGDYIVPIKRNQRHSLREIEELFSHFHGETAGTEDHGHGRSDARECRVLSTQKLSETFKTQWPDASRVFEITRYRLEKDKRFYLQKTGADGKQFYEKNLSSVKETETRVYYVTSRKLKPQEALEYVRTHWGIENKLHWTLDVAFREDECRVRAKEVANSLTVCRKIALNLIRNSKTKGSIKGRMKQAAWNNDFLEELIMTS